MLLLLQDEHGKEAENVVANAKVSAKAQEMLMLQLEEDRNRFEAEMARIVAEHEQRKAEMKMQQKLELLRLEEEIANEGKEYEERLRAEQGVTECPLCLTSLLVILITIPHAAQYRPCPPIFQSIFIPSLFLLLTRVCWM